MLACKTVARKGSKGNSRDSQAAAGAQGSRWKYCSCREPIDSFGLEINPSCSIKSALRTPISFAQPAAKLGYRRASSIIMQLPRGYSCALALSAQSSCAGPSARACSSGFESLAERAQAEESWSAPLELAGACGWLASHELTWLKPGGLARISRIKARGQH